MIGKIIGTLFVFIILFFAAAWLLEDKTPAQVLEDLGVTVPGKPGTTTTTSTMQAPTTYHYNYHVEVEGLEPLDYTVAVKVVERTKSRICFQYHLEEVRQGDPRGVEEFMYGFMGYHGAGETICTTTNPEDYVAKYYFTSPSVTGRAKLVYGEDNGLHGEALVENGVLEKMSLSGETGGHRASIEIVLSHAGNR